ncbi:MAG: carboxypeptidase-like regulatory domain-containing protein, partial [Acidobacteriaceae bacterium]
MKNWFRRLALSLPAALVVGMLLCGTSWAQENAELTGTVKDPSGAVVPNAKITLTDASTAEVRAGTTNGAGMYDFPALHNGTYNLKVTATGFEAYAKTGIVMDVAATVR